MNSPNKWRLIPLLSDTGKRQMAIDRWLLDQHENHGHPPTLRFYTWSRASISLGISQKRKKFPQRWQNLHYQGQPIDLIQRPTGGRGVLHQGDLTYSLIMSSDLKKVEDVYCYLCQFLIRGWKKLGVDIKFGKPNRDYMKSPNCFALATNADLVDSEGNKLIGSAQLKKGKYILQHGSMILNPDPDLYQQVFRCSPPQPNIDRNLSLETIVGALTETASEVFNCQFINQPLSAKELEQIDRLNS